MKQIFELTIIGRGGQGAKTASEVLAMGALRKGKYIQSFSEYGAERGGAPIFSYVRISNDPITIHTSVLNPDVVVVIDDSLLHLAPEFDGKLIVNTAQSDDFVKNETGHTGKVFTIDATSISVDILGRNIPNTPTLGAIARVSDILPKNIIVEELRNKLEKKIGKELMDRNIECLNRAYEEVK